MKKRVIAILMSIFLVSGSVGQGIAPTVVYAAEESATDMQTESDEETMPTETQGETEETSEETQSEEVESEETETEETETETETEETETEEAETETETETETEETETETETETEETEIARVLSENAGSITNVIVWDAERIAVASADNGLTASGDGWTTGGPDSAGAEAFGTDGMYAKAGGKKPTPNNGSIPTDGCYLQYEATEDGVLTICEKTQKSKKTFYVTDADGNVAAKATAGTASTYDELKVEVKAGQTYYAYMSGSTANVFQISFTPVQVVRTWDVEALLNTAEQGTDNGLTLAGDGWTTGGPDSAGAEAFGTDGMYAKAGGKKPTPNNGSIPTDGCYLQYEAQEDGKLTICEKTQKSNKTFYVVDADGNIAAKAKAGTASTYDELTFEVTQGQTYYAYMSGSTANIFQVYLTVGEKKVTAWSDVAAPVIDEVTVNDEGAFEVNFTAVIDAYKGAEQIQVIMYYEGHEASSTTIKKQADSIIFSPLWSGNYAFQIVAERAGEADKISQLYAYENYVLPVKKPVVEMAQNRGNATVYLDWLNVEGADYFNVYVKESTKDTYEIYAEELTQGHIIVENLEVGISYDFRIEAVRNTDGFTAYYEQKDFMVTQEAEQIWRFATVGSAQETHAVVYENDGVTVVQSIDMETKDTTANKQGIMDTTGEIVNTDKTIVFKPTGNGKISDGEEGFQYFYTMIDPNKDNFELTATFELTELYGGVFDNQTGYGIIATDLLGYNYYGTEGLWIKHKQLNSVSTQLYSAKAQFVGQRNISGYTSVDATSVEGVTRTTKETKFKNTAPDYTVGATYTFTLKKTDDAYISVCNGEEIAFDDLSILSVQEDGSLCIGVFAARNAGVKITDIQFSVSPSKGVTASEKTEQITPSVAILSSGTANTDTYEYIYHPNVAGQLTVTAPNGKKVYEKAVEANDVVRVKVPVTTGMNEIKSVLKVDETQNLTDYADITKTTKVEYQVIGNTKEIMYVSPDGTADGDGSKEKPYNLETVVKYAAPGQYIVLLDGTYHCNNVTIGRSVSGTAENHIRLVAEHADKVIFENFGLTIVGSYWDIYGIYVHYPNAVGLQISGNYNTISMCTVEGSANTGVQISRSGSVNREAGMKHLLWPSYNLVKNCTSFDNCDAGRNDADGFAAKLTSGEGNVFYGCIAHNNIDDGWDLFAKAISGEIGQVTIENCIAYDNGWLTYEDTTAAGYEYGEGNGFKLGGNDMYGGHILKNSVAYGNRGKGITSNSCPDCKVYLSTSYGNALNGDDTYNISLATKSSNKQLWEVEGLISVTAYTTNADQIPSSFRTENNFIFDGSTSRNNKAVTVSDDWFESVDTTVVPTRNADGTIDMHGLLVPTAECPENAGGRISTGEEAKTEKPEFVPGTEETPEIPETPDADTDDTTEGTQENENTVAESSEAENSSTADTTIQTVTVETAQVPLAAAPMILADGRQMQMLTLDKTGMLKMQLLHKYYGMENMVFAFAMEGGIGISVNTADMVTGQTDMDVRYTKVERPLFADGFDCFQLIAEKEQMLQMPVTLHVNLGDAYAGKTAYIFQRAADTTWQQVKIMQVNEIGNVAVETTAVTDYIIFIQK